MTPPDPLPLSTLHAGATTSAVSPSPATPSDLGNYPTSRSSHVSDNPVVRSRTWSEDITKTWNLPITGLESLSDRVERYLLYFQLTPEQIRCIYDKFLLEMKLGLEFHQANPKGIWEASRCSLKMIDTCIDDTMIPRGREKGTAIALELGGGHTEHAYAAKIDLQGGGVIKMTEASVSLRDSCSTYPKGLLDCNATASLLFDTLALLVKNVWEDTSTTVPQETQPTEESKTISSTARPTGTGHHAASLPVGFCVCFPVEQRSLDSAVLLHWVKGFETGRRTNDPIEGMNVAALLDCAFSRSTVPAKIVAVLNDTSSTLLSCAYEKPPRTPSCRVGFVLGTGVNGSYILPDAKQAYGYKGCIINCELGNFDKSLPVNDVDLEVDFADEATKGRQLFEKMVSTTYLGELCRRLVVKVWQNNAPPLAWVRYSMPWNACTKVINDTTENMDMTKEILEGLWEWDSTLEERRNVQRLFDVVFGRSAALAAIAIVALASQTDRLQPAMGGLTCAIGGPLYSKCPFYRKKLVSYFEGILDGHTASLIHLYEVNDGSKKGSGILAALLNRKP